MEENKKGKFLLYPYYDESKKSVSYFAFDRFEEKEVFERMLKISGVGPKTAFQLVQIPLNELFMVENLIPNFFKRYQAFDQTCKKAYSRAERKC